MDLQLGLSLTRQEVARVKAAMSPFILNYSKANFAGFLAAKAQLLAGAADLPVGFLGDSRAASYGGFATENLQAVNAMDARLAKELADDFQTNYQAAIGGHYATLSPMQTHWDTRIAQGAFALASDFNDQSVGGPYFYATGAGTWSFTPGVNCNTCDIYYLEAATAGTFSKQIDNGAASNVVATAGSGAIKKTTLSGSLGAHTFKINRVSGNVFIVGVVCYNSAVKNMNFINGGWAGCTIQQWNSVGEAYHPIGATPIFGFKLAFVAMGANDMAGGRSLSQIQADLRVTLAALKSRGCDVVVMGYPPLDPTGGSYGASYAFSYLKQGQFRDAIVAAAVAESAAFIDIFEAMGGAYDAGLMFDGLHANYAGNTVAVGLAKEIVLT